MNTVEEYISSGILEQFVLGELSEDKAQVVADMAARYPEVRHEISLIEDALWGLAENLAIEPPSGVFDKIIENTVVPAEEPPVTETSATKKKARRLPYWRYGVAATFTLKLIVMALAAGYWINWKNTESQLEDLQERYDRLEQNAQQVTYALLAINDPAFQTVVLQNQASPGDRVLAYWNPETYQIYLDPSQLSPSKARQQYQLWGTVDGDTVSLGAFSVATNTTLPQIKSFEGVAWLSGLLISTEPEGGSTSLSSEPLYQATLP